MSTIPKSCTVTGLISVCVHVMIWGSKVEDDTNTTSNSSFIASPSASSSSSPKAIDPLKPVYNRVNRRSSFTHPKNTRKHSFTVERKKSRTSSASVPFSDSPSKTT